MGGQRVLVVDDEPVVREVLTRYLHREGFEVDAAADGEDALAAFDRSRPDLVLLDLMLPKLGGFDVFTRIRRRAETPVIMLTARGQQADRISGLELGADDYVTKPFSPREVVARVRAVLRRSADAGSGELSSPDVGRVRVLERKRQVLVDGRPVLLTPKEFDLLAFLARHTGAVFTRLELLEELWDPAFYGDPSTVTVHIRRLREKVELDPAHPRHLVTVWGTGYRFEP